MLVNWVMSLSRAVVDTVPSLNNTMFVVHINGPCYK